MVQQTVIMLVGEACRPESTFRTYFVHTHPDYIPVFKDDIRRRYSRDQHISYTESFEDVHERHIDAEYHLHLRRVITMGNNVIADGSNRFGELRRELFYMIPAGVTIKEVYN